MQGIIERAKELLTSGEVARVLGWKAGDMPYNPEPAFFEKAEDLKDFVYNGFCGALGVRNVNASAVYLYIFGIDFVRCGSPILLLAALR